MDRAISAAIKDHIRNSTLKKYYFLSSVYHLCCSVFLRQLSKAPGGHRGCTQNTGAPSTVSCSSGTFKILAALLTAGPTPRSFPNMRGFTASGGSSAEITPLSQCPPTCRSTVLLEQVGLRLSRVVKDLSLCFVQ